MAFMDVVEGFHRAYVLTPLLPPNSLIPKYSHRNQNSTLTPAMAVARGMG